MPPSTQTPADVFRRVDAEYAQRARLVEQLKPLRAQKRALEVGVTATYALTRDAVTAAVRSGVLTSQTYYVWDGVIYYVRSLAKPDAGGGTVYTAVRIEPELVDEPDNR